MVFSRDPATGKLNFLEAQLDNVGGVDGINGAWATDISPDGRNLYVVGRDDDALAVFERNAATGALTFVEAQYDGLGPVEGLDGVISVAVSPDGRYVFTSARFGHAVAVFERDDTTGTLTFVEHHVDEVDGVEGLLFPGGLAVAPDGSNVYATGSLDHAVVTFEVVEGGAGPLALCHVPPGKPAEAHTIRVGQAAAPAHLAHGDSLGPCGDLLEGAKPHGAGAQLEEPSSVEDECRP